MRGQLPDLTKLLPALWARGDAMASAVTEALRPHAPVSNNPDRASGAFQASLAPESEPTANGVLLRTVSNLPYAPFVVNPTEPHEIVAVRAGALAFTWNGSQVFFRRVHHPGTKGNDFAEQNRGEMMAVLEPMLVEAWQEAMA